MRIEVPIEDVIIEKYGKKWFNFDNLQCVKCLCMIGHGRVNRDKNTIEIQMCDCK